MAFTLVVLGSVMGSPQLSGAASSGGSLVIGSAVAPPSLDPTSNASAAIDEVFDYNVYQHLVELDPKGAVIPVLATTYKVSSDGLTYTFAVRSGVTFSNGDPMTAADVAYSLNRAVDPKSGYPYQSLVADVSSVTAPNPSTVVVKLTHPDNQFLYNLAAYSNGMVLDPAAVASIATAPVGTGPYMYQSQISNYDVVLAANPNYWGPKPHLSTVTFRYFSSPSTMDSALQSGQIQVIDNLDNSQNVSQFKNNSSFKVIHGPTEGKIDLTLNNTAGPLKKLKVRQAITYATNKSAILKTVGAGYGTVIGSDQVPGDPWYTPSVNKAYSYNPAKARKLLAEAGYKHGFSITLTLPPYGYATTAGPLIQAELAAVGIKVTIIPIAAKDFGTALTKRTFQAIAFTWVGTPFPYPALNQFFNPKSSSDYSGYDNADVNALIAKVSTEMDQTKRDDYVLQAEKIAWTEVQIIPLYQRPDQWAVNSKVANYGAFGLSTPNWENIGFVK